MSVAVGAWVALAVFMGIYGSCKVRLVRYSDEILWIQLSLAAVSIGIAATATLQALAAAS